MNPSTPSPNPGDRHAQESSGEGDLRHESCADGRGTSLEDMRKRYRQVLIDELFYEQTLDQETLNGIQTLVRGSTSEASEFREALFKHILRAEKSFLSFIETGKPLPHGLDALRTVDRFLLSELSPRLSPQQRSEWLSCIVSHLAFLGDQSFWDKSHLEELRHAGDVLFHARGYQILKDPAHERIRHECARAIAAVLDRLTGLCDQISLYPRFCDVVGHFITIPSLVESLELKQNLQPFFARLREYLPKAYETSEGESSKFLGYRSDKHYEEVGSLEPFSDQEEEEGVWSIDLPDCILEQVLDDAGVESASDLELDVLSEAQDAYASMVYLAVDASAVLADLSSPEDAESWYSHCYEFSFYELEWFHYARALSRSGSESFTGVLTDLLYAASYDRRAALQLIALIGSDVLLDRSEDQRIVHLLGRASEPLDVECRDKIVNQLQQVARDASGQISYIAGIPLDSELIHETIAAIRARMAP